MLPAGSTLINDSLTLVCWTLYPRDCRWPSICLLPQVGNCSLIVTTNWSRLSSDNCEYWLETDILYSAILLLRDTPTMLAICMPVNPLSIRAVSWHSGTSNLVRPTRPERTTEGVSCGQCGSSHCQILHSFSK